MINPEEWVKTYGDYLYNYAYSRVFSKDRAEDILQDTFLYAWQNKDKFRGNSSEKTWLTAILKRKIADHYRKKSSAKEKTVEFNSPFIAEGFMGGAWQEQRAPQQWDVEEDLSEDENFIIVMRKCIALLPEKWKAVFMLRHIDNTASKQISESLDISVNNIWTILHRARLQLRECIENRWFKNSRP